MSIQGRPRLNSFFRCLSMCSLWNSTSLHYIASSVLSCQALRAISQREPMPITPSTWPLDGTALRSSCSGTSRVFHHLCWGARRLAHLVSRALFRRFSHEALPLWSQGSLREGGGHVVSGLHPGRAEWRAASVPGRERDRPALHHPESVGTPATGADEALL